MLLKICAILILVFGNIFIKTIDAGYATTECSFTSPVKTEGIHSNDFLFFYSPNFPQTFSNLTYSYSCSINLAAVEDGNRIWLAMLNGAVNQINLIDYNNNNNQTISYYNSNSNIVTTFSSANSLFFQIPENSSRQSWTAFEAVSIAYDPKLNLSCPFSSQIFDFSMNPEFVIPIASEFAADPFYTLKACNWAFTLNSTQNLKVVIKKLNLSQNFNLILNGDGNFKHVFNDTVYLMPKIYYFDGNIFNLSFINQKSNSSQSNFFILISAVFKTDTFTQNGCQNPTINGPEMTFNNIDYIKGYPKNQKCNNTIVIPAKNEAAIYLNENNIEMYSDKLYIKYENNQTFDIQGALFPSYFTLLPAVNGSSLIFQSDGNTQQSGYSATVKIYECKCPGDFIIACNQQKYMTPLPDNDGMYCDNMTCNYNVLPNPNCPNAYFYIRIYPVLRSMDYLILKDNGVMKQNITNLQRFNIPIYYSSKAKLNFEFSSGISKDLISPNAKQWFALFVNITTPNFTTLNFTELMPNNHVLWLDFMNKNDAITVCTNKTNNLEIFVTNSAFYSLSNYQLYDAGDLYSNIGNLDSKSITSSSPTIARSLKAFSGCFTLYKTSESSQNTQASILFKKTNINSNNNCNEKDTVFLPSIYGDNFETSSTNSGSCEMIILVGSAGIPRIWIAINETTPNSKYTFTDLVTNKKLFDLNSSEVSQWHTLGIYTTALSITVPPSSKISLTASNSITQTINIQSFPQKGIMTSPYYCSNPTLNNTLLYNFQQFSSNKNITANFFVKEFIGSPIIELQIDNSRQTLLSNQNVTVNGQSLQLYYSSKNVVADGFLIEYTLQMSNITTQNSSTQINFGLALIFTVILSMILF